MDTISTITSEIITCTECATKKVRLWGGAYIGTKARVKKHTNDKGIAWRGRTCPECVAFWRSSKEAINPKTKRNCRRCNTSLTPASYFHCRRCMDNLGEYDTETYSVSI